MNTIDQTRKNFKPREDQKIVKPRFDNLEQLNDRVLDLSETERKKQETAKEIADNLQYFVNQNNNNARGYLKDFKSRVQEKYEHRIWKKYFGNKSKTEILTEAKKNDEIYKKWKLYDNEIKANDRELKGKFKKDIYEVIKRLFNKEITTHGGSDIDKDAGLHLLKLARFFKNPKGENIDYAKKLLSHGERGEKGLEYDSGGTKNGLDIVKKIYQEGPHKGEASKSLFNALAIVDEHDRSQETKNINKPTSSTHMIFNLLNELGVLHTKHRDQIKRFVDFVDKVDSQDYQFSGADRQVSHKTLFGLHRKIPIHNIYEYFENPKHTGLEVLNEEELKKLNLKNDNQEEENERKMEERSELDKKGRFGNFNNERFMFALGKEFNGGQQMAGNFGAGYFKIFESGDLYMYSPNTLPSKISGLPTNGNFLNVKKINLEDLKKILDVFEFGKDSEKGLKENFLAYRKAQIEKENEKIEAEKNKEKNIQISMSQLPDFTKKDFKVGEVYTGMINNVANRIGYITLDQAGKINGRVKVENKKELERYTKGDQVKVKIEEISEEEGKLVTLSLVS